MNLVTRLRSKRASLHQSEVEAAKAYPLGNQGAMRSRVKRLMLASDADFQAAVAVYEAGGNINEIIAATSPATWAGAPVGNTNSIGKRTKPVLPRLNALWRVTSAADRATFLKQHGLSRTPNA